ncbi:hypothetical protein E2P60_05325 [Candidatus Bathyarchaeota archaeon]|nr:hypothetical protein E2P60_05325 [Candidatus Bathyarchaeota archaeon]
MERRNIKKNWVEQKGNRATLSLETRIIKVDAVKLGEANVHNLVDNLEEHNTREGHILFFVFLVVGMTLQLTGNTLCVLAGNLLCVSTCGLICIWVCISAVFSHNESKSLSGNPELLE